MKRLSILFWIRKNKANSRNEAPIICRITLDGFRCPEFSTHQRVPINEWNANTQRCPNDVVNLYLNTLRHDIETAFLELYNRNKDVKPMDLYNRIMRKANKECQIKDVLDEYMKYYEWLVEVRKIDFETYKHNFRYRKHIDKFLDEMGYNDLLAEKFDLKKCEELATWLTQVSTSAYRVKIVYFVVSALSYCREKGMINSNPAFGYKLKKPAQKAPVSLTWEELNLILNHRFASDRLQQVADRFIWQCFTGQAWGDLERFDKNKYLVTDGHTWLEYARAKNDQVATVPMLPQAIAILHKYPAGFPPISGQKYNAYLKEVADIVGIDKRITSHTGRKTFSNVMENNFNMSIETVAAMLGHTDSKTTRKYYTRIDRSRIVRELRKVEMVA